ncbi:MAG: hypothetical protein HY784_03785 [Chloroflexi bacterium]|nr:hypothetical protein [Chloroflexota bacterium]
MRLEDLNWMDVESYLEAHGDGSFGGPYPAPDPIIDQLFAAALAEVVDILGRL